MDWIFKKNQNLGKHISAFHLGIQLTGHGSCQIYFLSGFAWSADLSAE